MKAMRERKKEMKILKVGKRYVRYHPTFHKYN
jgi:hypothetical protein